LGLHYYVYPANINRNELLWLLALPIFMSQKAPMNHTKIIKHSRQICKVIRDENKIKGITTALIRVKDTVYSKGIQQCHQDKRGTRLSSQVTHTTHSAQRTGKQSVIFETKTILEYGKQQEENPAVNNREYKVNEQKQEWSNAMMLVNGESSTHTHNASG